MKIKEIILKNYLQFKDLKLDLTYPKGHKKEGQPLDKICIIGQSGTGKTNLLKIIRDKLYKTEAKTIFENKNSNNEKIYFREIYKYDCNEKENKLFIKKMFPKISEFKLVIFFQIVSIMVMFSALLILFSRMKEALKLETISYLTFLIVNIISILFLFALIWLVTTGIVKKMIDIYLYKKEKNNIKSNEENKNYTNLDETAWLFLKDRIENYKNELLQIKDELSNKLLNSDDYSKEDFRRELKEWEEKNENILEKISDNLNIFLKKFNLKLHKIDENQKSYNDLIFEDLSNKNIITYDNLSSGTRNLISTFIPLQIHNPKDSIILIDEPENSFYPDIQKKLTEVYSEVGENNQLIFATHSPIIASSFEPWEVVELKFDENNQIYREKYYQGENHIDNYILDPRMLTWTSILIDIFDLKEDSSSFREKKLIEYAELKAEIKSMEKGKEREEKIKKFKKLSKLLGLDN